MLALAATGIAVILVSGTLGAATSGRGFLSHWFSERPPEENSVSTRVRSADDLTRAFDLPEALDRSGA
jgi:hypothetical protein